MVVSQYQKNRLARKALEEIFRVPHSVVFIHYSCESFYGITDGSSPRITSIALRFFGSGQTKSFSIHHEAELTGIKSDKIGAQYNNLEKKMLKRFYKTVEQFAACKWIHWNMRDANYGFEAIAHRYKVLGGRPAEIQDTNKIDLANMMHGLLGRNYVPHPRLLKLLEMNEMVPRNFLPGKDEAEAFDQKQFVKLHQSTLSKVDTLMDLAVAASERRLKCNNNYFTQRGLTLSTVGAVIKDHPLFAAVGVIAVVLSIVASIVKIYSA